MDAPSFQSTEYISVLNFFCHRSESSLPSHRDVHRMLELLCTLRCGTGRLASFFRAADGGLPAVNF